MKWLFYTLLLLGYLSAVTANMFVDKHEWAIANVFSALGYLLILAGIYHKRIKSECILAAVISLIGLSAAAMTAYGLLTNSISVQYVSYLWLIATGSMVIETILIFSTTSKISEVPA